MPIDYCTLLISHSVGYVGIQYVLDVFIADTSSLKNRPWLFAFSTCPFIANSFAGPAAAEAFYTGSTWRWGFGSFTIIVPVVCAPVVAIFIYNRNKAKKQGVLQEKQHTRSPLASLGHYTVEFDGECIVRICLSGCLTDSAAL